jgi:hypothetical protein
MKKVNIKIKERPFGSYAIICFKSRPLENAVDCVVTKDYKTPRGALGAAKRFCDEYGLEYEVIENGK